MANGRDYVAIAKAYCAKVIRDTKHRTYGLQEFRFCHRFLVDLKRAAGKRPPFIFDEWHANDPCDFIEKLPHVEGSWDSDDIVLHESHVLFIVQLFGFRKHNGTRRFTKALFAVARKNAKSTLAAAIMLYCLACEDEIGGQFLSAATTYSQASIIWKTAKMMATKCSDLCHMFGIELWAKAITRSGIGASFKAIHSKASTQDGLNPSHTAVDEIHAHKDGDLMNVLESAAGGRRNPLWLYTTTEGYINAGPWSELRHYAKQVLAGLFGVESDNFLVMMYCLDDGDKELDESTWRKANPLIEVNPVLLDAIRADAISAKRMPSKMAEFRIKRLNRQASVEKGWVNLGKWMKCADAVDLEKLKNVHCWGGLDLSSTTDLTSFRLVWWFEGVLYTWGRRWVPADAVAARTERGTVPYAAWIAAGHIEQTDGDVVDYAVIEAAIRDANERFNVQGIAYDKWNAQELCNRLTNDNIPMIEFVQGTKSYHPAMQCLEKHYIGGTLRHSGDPVLAWCAANFVARKDVNLNLAPDKRKSPEKIDDMCALLMATGLSIGFAESDTIEQGFVKL